MSVQGKEREREGGERRRKREECGEVQKRKREVFVVLCCPV